MVTKEASVIRTAIDTNVVISALLFHGEVSRLHKYWKQNLCIPLFTKDTFDELRQVLSYPKFKLDSSEILYLLQEEIIPYCEIV